MKAALTEAMLTSSFEYVIDEVPIATSYPSFSHFTREMDCQQGRLDLVASANKPDALPIASALLAEALSTRSLAHVVSLLHAEVPRHRDDIINDSILSAPIVRKALRRLEEFELAYQSECNVYYLSTAFPTIEWELWAFEVKLSNWKRALYQALQYQAFAHFSVVVVAEQWAHRIEKHIDAFKVFGVGIFALRNDTKALRPILLPKRQNPRSRFHHYYALGTFLSSVPPTKH